MSAQGSGCKVYSTTHSTSLLQLSSCPASFGPAAAADLSSLGVSPVCCANMSPTNAFLAAGLIGQALTQQVPSTAQIVDQRTFNVLPSVPPPAIANDSTVSLEHGAII